MDNKQGTVIGLGCIAIGCLGYFYYQFHKQSQSYKQKSKELQRTCKKYLQPSTKIDYQELKKTNKKLPIFIPRIQSPQIKSDTYKQYTRQRAKGIYIWRDDDFQSNQTGGSFKILDKFNQDKQLKVQINDCNIHNSILQKNCEKKIIFEQNKNKQSVNQSITLLLDCTRFISLYGMIGYSISEQCFIIQPQFIVSASKNADPLQQMLSFWNEKHYFSTFKKISLAIIITALGYLTLYIPFKSIWNRYKLKFSEVSKGEFEYFRNKSNFSAKTTGALMCQICTHNNISMVYECGHLAVCDQCHANSLDKKCSLCYKSSKKFMKIFL